MSTPLPGSSKKATYYSAAIVAYTIWGFFSLVLRPLDIYTAADILFYRVFCCAILMVLIVFLFRRKKCIETVEKFRNLPPDRKRMTILLNIGGSIFLTGNWFSFIYVM